MSICSWRVFVYTKTSLLLRTTAIRGGNNAVAALRFAKATDRDGRQTRYSYTERGLIKTISTDEGTISYTYDGAGRVIEQTAYTEANGHTYRTRYRYAGRTVTEERGAYITTYTLDGWGKPILKTNGGGWAEKKVIIFMYQLIKRKDM